MSFRRIFAILKKEFIHILRDYRSLIVILLMPVLMLLLYGNAISLDPRSMGVAFVDLDHSQSSRQLIETFKGSGFFEVKQMLDSEAPIETLLKQRAFKAAIVIPEKFEQRMKRDRSIPVQVVADASDSNSATLISNFVSAIALDFSLKNLPISPPITVVPRMLYNPDGKTMYFILPGIVAVIMILISALLSSLTLVREKETGTLEQILVSPLSSAEIVLGKVIPYLVLAFIDGLLILGCAYLIYHLPFRGSMPLLMGLNLLYIFAGLSIGLLISSVAKTQKLAIMVCLAATIMPTMMLSGFMFPVESMPKLLQYISAVIPARYFLIIIRGILVKGIGFEYLIPSTIFLASFTLALLFVSVLKFKSRLE